MKSFIIKYKWDIICYSLILFCFAILSVLYWGKLGNPIIDCGREAYIPSAVLRGKVLYKDIFNIYGPLGYQINAVIYFILGENFNALYTAGTINALIIITCLYYLYRQYLNKFLSTASCLLILTLCCFSPGECLNFIFPYSYSTYYSLTFFLLSFIFLFNYLKKDNKNIFAPLSFLALGISAAFKIEFILFLLVLIGACVYLKPVGRKMFLISMGLFFLVPILSMSILFLQGLNFHDIASSLNFITKYAKAPAMIDFLKQSRVYPPYATIPTYLYRYLSTIGIFIMLNYFLYLILQIKDKFKLNQLVLIIWFGLIFQMICDRFEYIKMIGLHPWQSFVFIGWLGLGTLFILAVQLIYYFKKQDKTFEDKFFLIMIITSIITNRSLFFTNTSSFSNFTVPLSFFITLIFWVKYIPSYIKSIEINNWQKASSICIFCASLFFGISYYIFSTNIYPAFCPRLFPLITAKGTIYVKDDEGYSLKNTLNYIKTYFPKNATFAMYPEGPLLNFITERSSSNFHTLVPPGVEAFGEDFIINSFSKDSPDYILINNKNMSAYGHKYFGTDYARKLMSFIDKQYFLVKTFKKNNNDFHIKIYRKKNYA